MYCSVIKPSSPADWRTYRGGDTARLAILLTDESSAWLGLVHGLKSLGLPFTLTISGSTFATRKACYGSSAR